MRWVQSRKNAHVVLEGESRTFCNQIEDVSGMPEASERAVACRACASRLHAVVRWQEAEDRMSEQLGYTIRIALRDM